MTSSSINAPTEKISNGIFIQALSKGQLDISCNWCTFSVYRGEDTDHPDVDWLRTMIEHLVSEHPKRFI